MLENSKTCTFYASDYHFEMIILPYVNKKLEEKNNILIFTQNNLKNSIDTLISRMSLNDEKKQKILNLDWKNNDFQKFENLKQCEKNNKKTVVFIKGTEDYIRSINESISKNMLKSNLKIVDCYPVDDLRKNMTDITNKYQNYLNTSGETKID